MAKFFVDAFADMFGAELEKNNLILAPSKLKIGKNIIDFKVNLSLFTKVKVVGWFYY